MLLRWCSVACAITMAFRFIRLVDGYHTNDVCTGHVIAYEQRYKVILTPPNSHLCRGQITLQKVSTGEIFCIAKDPDLNNLTPITCDTSILTTTTTTTTTTTMTTIDPYEICGRENLHNSPPNNAVPEYLQDRFPWLVYIQRMEEDNTQGTTNLEYRTMCTGTLVSHSVVLTNYRCVSQPMSGTTKYRILYGQGSSYDSRTKAPSELFIGFPGLNPDNRGRGRAAEEHHSENRHVTSIHRIQYYNDRNSVDDIAALRINRIDYFTKYVGAICLPYGNGEFNREGVQVTTVGCCVFNKYIDAFNKESGVQPPPEVNPGNPVFKHVRYLDGSIQPRSACEGYGQANAYGVCIAQSQQDTRNKMKCFCTGGGPAATKRGTQWFQVSVGSYLFGHAFRPCTCQCAVKDYQGVMTNTNVAFFHGIDEPHIIGQINSYVSANG